jgi:hypothetical protein
MNINVWQWNSPVALAIFIVGLALSFALFSWAVKNFTEIDQSSRRR